MTETLVAKSRPRITVSLVFYTIINVGGIALLFIVPFSWKLVALWAFNYTAGMFFITAGYHRYFSHRSFQLGRVAQFFLAWMAQASIQKGVLWWAANHRDHHIHSDTDLDLHSPVKRGFWYSHMGWIFDPKSQSFNVKKIQDFNKYPELRWLNNYHWVPTVVQAAFITTLFYFLDIPGITPLAAFAWGYLFVIVCCYQASYTINSLSHVYGKRRFETTDHSRNNWFLAIITLGEGWHNNHHHCKSACRQGYKWYEYDLTYYILKGFSFIGIVKNIRPFRADNTKGVIVEAPVAKKELSAEAA
ncbi:MAG: fatty acid desaturase [Bacteroidota bacterium]|nr:fatty acid desaturase [Bacteroidota bacterium]